MKLRGDCRLALNASQIKNAFRARIENQLLLRFDVPLSNISAKEQALLIYAGILRVPHSKNEKLQDSYVRLGHEASARSDGYFEAVLVKPGKSLFLQVELLLQGENAVAQVLSQKELPFDLSCSYYGRAPLREEHFLFSVPMQAFADKPSMETEVMSFRGQKPKNPLLDSSQAQNNITFPVETPIVFPGTDLAALIQTYAGNRLKAGDWIAMAESMVAIAQGRVYPITGIRPGFWAKRLNRFFHFNSSLASCYSMEMAIREAGLPRIILGVIFGFLGRLFGRSGDFYRIAGRSVASIDDATGTLPPFDKSVVLGPKNPNQVAENLHQSTGYEIAIVDANDLGEVDILGKSRGIISNLVVKTLRKNPQGNADEQTPIVVINPNKNI